MPPTILITRPEATAVIFADQLRARLGCGVTIVMSPLMRIENCGTLPDLDGLKTLLFTSRNGVAAFAAKTGRRDIPCICVGEATAGFARSHGLDAAAAAGTGDDLVRHIVAHKVKGPCLHVRGEHGVGEISSRLTKAGIPTEDAVLYQQVQQPLTKEADELLQGENPVLLPLFSPRTARIFFSTTPARAPLSVIALSVNVANEVPDTQSGTILVAENPDAEAMIEAIEDLVAAGKLLEAGNRAQ